VLAGGVVPADNERRPPVFASDSDHDTAAGRGANLAASDQDPMADLGEHLSLTSGDRRQQETDGGILGLADETDRLDNPGTA
jgi:hypothetical protein